MQDRHSATLVLGHGEKILLYRFEDSACGAQWMQRFARSYQDRIAFDNNVMALQRKYRLVLCGQGIIARENALLEVDVIKKPAAIYAQRHGFSGRIAEVACKEVGIPYLRDDTVSASVIQIGLQCGKDNIGGYFIIKKLLYLIPTLL